AACGRVLQALVHRHAGALSFRAAVADALHLHRMAEQRMRGAQRDIGQACARQALLEHRPQRRPVDARKEVLHVELQIPSATLARMHLAHELAHALYGLVRAFALAVRVRVEDEAELVDRLQLWHEPVMHDAVAEIRRVDLTRLRPRGDEARGRQRAPRAGVQSLLQLQQSIHPAHLESELVATGLLAPACRFPCVVQRLDADLSTLTLTGTRHQATRPHDAAVVVAVVVVDVAVVAVDLPERARCFPVHLRPGHTAVEVAWRRHALASPIEAERALSVLALCPCTTAWALWP